MNNNVKKKISSFLLSLLLSCLHNSIQYVYVGIYIYIYYYTSNHSRDLNTLKACQASGSWREEKRAISTTSSTTATRLTYVFSMASGVATLPVGSTYIYVRTYLRLSLLLLLLWPFKRHHGGYKGF